MAAEDQRFLFVNDELDEETHGTNTRTIVFDVSDLENPKVHFEHLHEVPSIDHNNYVHQGLLYQSNYTSGLRVLDTAFVNEPQNPRLERVAFFDTYPANDDPIFEGTWSNYPFFESGTIAVSGMNEGLFLLRARPAVKVKCKGCPIRMRAGQKRRIKLRVSNVGIADQAYAFAVQRGPKRWKTRFRPRELDLMAGDRGRTRLRLAVPRRTDPGRYRLIAQVTSTVGSAVVRSVRIPVRVR